MKYLTQSGQFLWNGFQTIIARIHNSFKLRGQEYLVSLCGGIALGLLIPSLGFFLGVVFCILGLAYLDGDDIDDQYLPV